MLFYIFLISLSHEHRQSLFLEWNHLTQELLGHLRLVFIAHSMDGQLSLTVTVGTKGTYVHCQFSHTSGELLGYDIKIVSRSNTRFSQELFIPALFSEAILVKMPSEFLLIVLGG